MGMRYNQLIRGLLSLSCVVRLNIVRVGYESVALGFVSSSLGSVYSFH